MRHGDASRKEASRGVLGRAGRGRSAGRGPEGKLGEKVACYSAHCSCLVIRLLAFHRFLVFCFCCLP